MHEPPKMRTELLHAIEMQEAENDGLDFDDLEVPFEITGVVNLNVRFQGIPFDAENLLAISVFPGETLGRDEFRKALVKLATQSIDRVLDEIDAVLEGAEDDHGEDSVGL